MCRRIAAVIVDMIAAGDSQLLAVRVDATEVTALMRPVSGESLVDRTLEVRKFEVTPRCRTCAADGLLQRLR
jgi:hypothetical protein